jgi:hypothetical protein
MYSIIVIVFVIIVALVAGGSIATALITGENEYLGILVPTAVVSILLGTAIFACKPTPDAPVVLVPDEVVVVRNVVVVRKGDVTVTSQDGGDADRHRNGRTLYILRQYIRRSPLPTSAVGTTKYTIIWGEEVDSGAKVEGKTEK